MRPRNLTFDSGDPQRVGSFWAAALGLEMETGEDHSFVFPLGWDPDGEMGPRFLFQRVPELKVIKNRLHLDLTAEDMAAEVKRLTALGARQLKRVEEDGLVWTVMADPEGNEFCVLQSPDDYA